jgi:hypothetical protein
MNVAYTTGDIIAVYREGSYFRAEVVHASERFVAKINAIVRDYPNGVLEYSIWDYEVIGLAGTEEEYAASIALHMIGER